MRIFHAIVMLLLLAGCQSVPKPVADTSPKQTQPKVLAPAQVPLVPAEITLQNTKEALQARDLLLNGEQEHLVLAKSSFRTALGFTAAGWSGMVLSPKDLKQGVVVGFGYKIERVEIHPLTDGRLRVWVEVINLTAEWLQPEGACEFRPDVESGLLQFKPLPALAPLGGIIVAFESAHPQIEGYSILVRSKRQ